MSEMMPDYGCFTIAWTSYGIVIPLVEQFFGIQPDAMHKTDRLRSASADGLGEHQHRRSARRNEYDFLFTHEEPKVESSTVFDATKAGWNFILKGTEIARRQILSQWQSCLVQRLRHPHERKRQSPAHHPMCTIFANDGTPRVSRMNSK